MTEHDALSALRARIDEIDDAMAALFEERLAVCREIGRVKHAAARPVRDPTREEIVLSRRQARIADAQNAQPVRALYQEIMKLCAEAQNTPCEGDATWRSTDTYS